MLKCNASEKLLRLCVLAVVCVRAGLAFQFTSIEQATINPTVLSDVEHFCVAVRENMISVIGFAMTNSIGVLLASDASAMPP